MRARDVVLIADSALCLDPGESETESIISNDSDSVGPWREGGEKANVTARGLPRNNSSAQWNGAAMSL